MAVSFPAPGASVGPVLYGVGVGPGDPELLTLRAVRLLQEASCIFVPVVDPAVEGRAEFILRRANLLEGKKLVRLVFAMAENVEQREDCHRTAAVSVSEVLLAETKCCAVFATLGDPNVYSTFTALSAAVQEIRPDIEIATVPGIMAAQELAARTGRPLAVGSETLTILPGVDLSDEDGADRFSHLLECSDTIVCYKAGARFPAFRKVLLDADRLSHAVIGIRMGWRDKGAGTFAVGEEIPNASLDYFSTLLVRRPE